jgi:O-antigen/teichoic acid export membrane protein
VAMQVDNLVVGRWLGAEALGLYARAYNIAIAPASLLAQNVQSVTFSAASRLEHDRPRLAVAHKRAVTSIILVTLPASVVLAMLASEIVLLVLGPQWNGAVVPLTILSFGLSMKVCANVSFAAGAAVGAVYGMASRHALAAVAVLAGALTGQFWGLGGVCVGVLAAIAINYALAAEFARRMTSGSLADLARAHVPGLAASAAIAVQLWFVRRLALFFDLHEFLIVLLGLATSAGTMVLILRAIARLLPQSDTVWALAAVLRIVPPKLRRLAHRAVGLRDGAARAAASLGAVAGDLPEPPREPAVSRPLHVLAPQRRLRSEP